MGDPVRLRVAALARALGMSVGETTALVELLGNVAAAMGVHGVREAPRRRRESHSTNETGSLFPPNPPIPSSAKVDLETLHSGSGEDPEEVLIPTRARSIPRAERAERWPPDLTLTEERRAIAVALGLDVVWEWNWFRDHHRAKGSRFVSWHDAWRTWCRRAYEYGRGRQKA